MIFVLISCKMSTIMIKQILIVKIFMLTVYINDDYTVCYYTDYIQEHNDEEDDDIYSNDDGHCYCYN